MPQANEFTIHAYDHQGNLVEQARQYPSEQSAISGAQILVRKGLAGHCHVVKANRVVKVITHLGSVRDNRNLEVRN